jgi:hypothetical protein
MVFGLPRPLTRRAHDREKRVAYDAVREFESIKDAIDGGPWDYIVRAA